LDGNCAQAIERGDLPREAMTDQQLMAIGRGGSREPLIEPARICSNETVVQGLRIDLGMSPQSEIIEQLQLDRSFRWRRERNWGRNLLRVAQSRLWRPASPRSVLA
jgi:hypothetical protein